jgi:hypothetical protein
MLTRTRTARLAVAAALVVLVAGVTATVAHALAFDDGTPCPTGGAADFVCPQGTVGTSYSIQLVGHGGCGPDGANAGLPYQYRVLSGALPPGLSLSSSGAISGTPTQSGTFAAYLELSDENPPSQSWCLPKQAQRQFFFNIGAGLQIVTNSLPTNASVGQPYSVTLDARTVTNLNPLTGNPATGATWSVPTFGTGLPPGLTLNNGVISGTPTAEGAFTFRIQASLNGATHFQTYSLNVRQPLTATGAKPLATPPLPTVWEVGLPFAAKITPSGGSGTYTVTLASGTLPTGLVLGPDGAVSGTPTTPGVFRAAVGLADSEGRTAEYAANFAVAQRLAVTTVALKRGKVGKLYRAKVASTGGVNPRLWKLAGGKLPKGLKFDRRLGVVSGIPKKAGSPRVTFQVTDGLRVIAKKTLRIVIAPTPKR